MYICLYFVRHRMLSLQSWSKQCIIEYFDIIEMENSTKRAPRFKNSIYIRAPSKDNAKIHVSECLLIKAPEASTEAEFCSQFPSTYERNPGEQHMQNYYSGFFFLHQITKHNWKETLKNIHPDFFLHPYFHCCSLTNE